MKRAVLTGGRIISVPLIWFPLLMNATPGQRARCEKKRRRGREPALA